MACKSFGIFLQVEDHTGQPPQDDEYKDESEDESGERSDDNNDNNSGDGYLNLMKRSQSGCGGFLRRSRKATDVPLN